MIYREFLPTLPSLLAAPNTPYIHRDMSWLQFNNRVLAEARNTGNPLLERVKFLAISASNLDEFFMIRLSSLSRAIQVGGVKRKSNRYIKLRSAILEEVAKFGAKQVEALDILSGELTQVGVHLVKQLTPQSSLYELGKQVFTEQVLPTLQAPEPFTFFKLSTLENLQTAVIFSKLENRILKIPKTLPGVYLAPFAQGVACFFLDDLLLTYLGEVLRYSSVPALVRLTRDGDFQIDLEDEDTESIPDIVRSGVGNRERGRPSRLQYLGNANPEFLKRAFLQLKLTPAQVLPASDSLYLQALWTLVQQVPDELSKQLLRYKPLPNSIPRQLQDKKKIFSEIKKQDILLHHPYDSFDSYVQWITAACEDPDVLSIEQTIYRMDALSPIIGALKQAATQKKVRVVIELRARFDELNNLRLTDELRKAGVEVAFGFKTLKLHAKVTLITRKETETLNGETQAVTRHYTHLSTGNYNASTARQYTDLSILTANPEIGKDARTFFDAAWAGQLPSQFKHLIPAPIRLHRKLISLITSEIEATKQGQRGRIIAKVNALVDTEVIDQLYQASQAGVQVDLIVRGACSLIPGVKGLSENIRVISVVDRFLEHSRIYFFSASETLYLSSADWMPRNFFSRMEIAFPVLDPLLRDYITQVILPTYLLDTQRAKELTPQGTWKRRTSQTARIKGDKTLSEVFPKKPIRSQFFFEELAANHYKNTPIQP